MGDRIGRNGRCLGKRSSAIDRLDENAKKRLLESSGINDDGLEEEERDSILKAILESKPNFKEEENLQKAWNSNDSNQSSPGDISALNQQPTLSTDDDDATQPPNEIQVSSDSALQGQASEPQEPDAGAERGGRNIDPDSPELMQAVVDRQAAKRSPYLQPDRVFSVSDRGLENPGQTESVCSGDEAGKPSPSARVTEVTESPVDEEETQFYEDPGDQLVLETQRSEASPPPACSEPAIPDSPVCDSVSDEEKLSMGDSRVDQNNDTARTAMKSPLNSSISTSLLQTMNPLWPALHCRESGLDKDCCTQVVKLMFELYMRRVCREQKRLSQSVAWGCPVETGPHVEDCLRCKRGSKKVQFSSEAHGLKKTILTRLGRSACSDGGRRDIAAHKDDDNIEEDDDDDDFQSHASGLRFPSRNRSRTEFGACDLTLEETTRRNTRLSATKARQRQKEFALSSSSEENDGDDGDAWLPNQAKTTRNRQTTKRKLLKQEQTNSGKWDKHDDRQELQSLGIISKIAHKPAAPLPTEEPKEILTGVKEALEENSSLAKKTALDEEDLDVERKLSSKVIYKFNSESGEDSNDHGSMPHAKAANGIGSVVSMRDHERVAENVIELSDSDQSTDQADPNSCAPKTWQKKEQSASRSKMRAVRGASGETDTHDDFAMEVRAKAEILPDLPDPASEEASEDDDAVMIDTLAQASNNPDVCVSPKSGSPEALPVLPDVNDASSRDSVAATSCSQSSNSLLDQQGQIISTQIERSSRKLKENLQVRSSRSNPESNVGEDAPQESLMGTRIGNRKRKAVGESEDSVSKRPVLSGGKTCRERKDPEDVECDLEGGDEGALVRKIGRPKRQNRVDSKKEKPAVQLRLKLSKPGEIALEDLSSQEIPKPGVKEDLSSGEMDEDLPGGAELGKDEIEQQRRQQLQQPGEHDEEDGLERSTDENQQQLQTPEQQQQQRQLPPPGEQDEENHHQGDQVEQQRSLLEDLTSEVDEQALSTCPICNKEFALILIEAHASTCGEEDPNEEVDEPDPQARLRDQQMACQPQQLQLAGTSGRRVTRSKRGDQLFH